jgi:hypothetical protein
MRGRRVLFACAILSLPAQPVLADVVLESRYPVKGEAVGIRITDTNGAPVTGATLEVTYRPGSAVQRTEEIGSSSSGALQWTPSEAGIATITATWMDANQTEVTSATNVSIKFSAPPVNGIIIMVVAGLLLVVGSIIRVTNLIRSPQSP